MEENPNYLKKLEGLGPQFYCDLELPLNFGFNDIWHDLFFRDGFHKFETRKQEGWGKYWILEIFLKNWCFGV